MSGHRYRPDTRHWPRVNRVPLIVYKIGDGVGVRSNPDGGIKIVKVTAQFPTKKRKLNHDNYLVRPGLEYKNSRAKERLHGVTVVWYLYRNLRFYPCFVMFTKI